ncbi:hypothetical protein ARMGADRAFT_1023266 [Armillaria gallica]|uniref:Uncharacterized protein n=1 Tax=Armillaria gallica TaxID=47427 RepID=A0A2H3EQ23_ARMGA|nr:hypothetical protein ARMGADRAFT_1023266 [Armillaria gallica]
MYHDSTTSEPYKLALTPPDLSLEAYKVLEKERGTAEERYEEAVTRHNEWKVETLKKVKLEAERKVEEKRQEEEWLWLEAKKEKVLALEREKQKAMEHQRLANLKEQENKKKKKEMEKKDEANEMALQTAGAPSASDGDLEMDLADPKMAAIAELKRRQRITKGKNKTEGPESQKCKIRSASRVEESKDEVGGPLTPKCLKTEPAPRAEDKADKAICFICSSLQTCQWCCVKKARCSFNKGSNDSSAAESTMVMELLQDIFSRLVRLEDKVEHVVEHVEDLMNDYHPDHNVKYPDDLPSKSMMAEFEVSQLELEKTRGIYSEVLCKMATQCLDQDMTVIKVKGLQSLAKDLPLGIEDPYEILNKSWVGTVRVTARTKMIMHEVKSM